MEPKSTKISIDFLATQEFYRDPRLLTIKEKLMQEYQRRTQTARLPPPRDSEVLKVHIMQLRRQLNSLRFANLKREQRLHELENVSASMTKSVESAVTPDTLTHNHSILLQDSSTLIEKPKEGDQVAYFYNLLKAAEDRIEAEEFTRSQLQHVIEQTTDNIVRRS